MSTQQHNLTPCRYCGKEEIIVDEVINEYFFVCCDCGAQGPTGSTVEEAAEKWNAPSDEVLQLRAELVKERGLSTKLYLLLVDNPDTKLLADQILIDHDKEAGA